jgi:predicted transcriptional regulator YdeE
MIEASEIRPPRLEHFGPVTLVGVQRPHMRAQDAERIFKSVTAQWEEYMALRPAPLGLYSYGIYPRLADGATIVDYFCGAPAASTGDLPPGFSTRVLPELYCAVFQYREHITKLVEFVQMIIGTVLPMAGLEMAPDGADAPEFIERFGASYNPGTGMGGLEVLVPLKE